MATPNAGAQQPLQAPVNASAASGQHKSQAPPRSHTHGGVDGHDDAHEHHEHHWSEQPLCSRPKLQVDWSESGSVKRRDMDRHISWTELFFDLIYVSAIARIGEDLRGEDGAHPRAIYEYLVLFYAILGCWYHVTYYATRWFSDDLGAKTVMAAMMMGVTLLAVHCKGDFHSLNITVFCYTSAGLRFLLSLNYMSVLSVTMTKHPRYLKYSFYRLGNLFFEAAMWILAALVPHLYYVRLAAMFMGGATVGLNLVVLLIAPQCTPRFPPLDLEHFVERLGLFFIIVLGESVTGISVNVNRYPVQFYLAILFGFLSVFATKLLYFDASRASLDEHALRTSRYRGATWGLLQWVLFPAAAVAGSGVAMLATVTGDAGDYLRVSRMRWFIGCGVGVSMITLSAIRSTHLPKVLADPRYKCHARFSRSADALQAVLGALGCAAPCTSMQTTTLMALSGSSAMLNAALNVAITLQRHHSSARHHATTPLLPNAPDMDALVTKPLTASTTHVEPSYGSLKPQPGDARI